MSSVTSNVGDIGQVSLSVLTGCITSNASSNANLGFFSSNKLIIKCNVILVMNNG